MKLLLVATVFASTVSASTPLASDENSLMQSTKIVELSSTGDASTPFGLDSEDHDQVHATFAVSADAEEIPSNAAMVETATEVISTSEDREAAVAKAKAAMTQAAQAFEDARSRALKLEQDMLADEKKVDSKGGLVARPESMQMESGGKEEGDKIDRPGVLFLDEVSASSFAVHSEKGFDTVSYVDRAGERQLLPLEGIERAGDKVTITCMGGHMFRYWTTDDIMEERLSGDSMWHTVKAPGHNHSEVLAVKASEFESPEDEPPSMFTPPVRLLSKGGGRRGGSRRRRGVEAKRRRSQRRRSQRRRASPSRRRSSQRRRSQRRRASSSRRRSSRRRRMWKKIKSVVGGRRRRRDD